MFFNKSDVPAILSAFSVFRTCYPLFDVPENTPTLLDDLEKKLRSFSFATFFSKRDLIIISNSLSCSIEFLESRKKKVPREFYEISLKAVTYFSSYLASE